MRAFRADKGGVNQIGITDSTYVLLSMTNEVADQGAHYDAPNSRWTPPAGPIIISGQAWVSGGVSVGGGGYTDCVAKVFKNGAGITTGIGTWCAFAGSMVCPIVCVDVANGTDYYEVFIFTTSQGNVAQVDGNPAHTWWGGVSV